MLVSYERVGKYGRSWTPATPGAFPARSGYFTHHKNTKLVYRVLFNDIIYTCRNKDIRRQIKLDISK